MAEIALVEDARRGITLEVLVAGEEGRDAAVLVPSALRGGADFADLQASLAEDGYRTLALNPRGAGASTPPASDLTLRDLADDVALVAAALGGGRVHLVGHALGNVVVRATASYRPEVAASVAVMPCGGHNLGAYPVAPEVIEAFMRCHDDTCPAEERLLALQIAFFAPGNDASAWLDGWWPASNLGAVSMQTDPEEWWRAGTAPVLIMQPREDAMAPTQAGRDSAAAFGDRATYVEVPRCGHAILPEQPAVIAANLVAFLRAHPLEP